MTDFAFDPTDEEVVAIAAIIFHQPSRLDEPLPVAPGWRHVGLIEGVHGWTQPYRLSRLSQSDPDS